MEENLREEVFENLGIPRAVALFLEILENVALFAPGSCRKFKREVLVEWKSQYCSQGFRTSLHLACVASVSNRVIARKLERKQKKG